VRLWDLCLWNFQRPNWTTLKAFWSEFSIGPPRSRSQLRKIPSKLHDSVENGRNWLGGGCSGLGFGFFLIWFAKLLVQGSCSLLYSRKERGAEAGSCLQQVYKTGKNIFVTTCGGKELFLLRWSK